MKNASIGLRTGIEFVDCVARLERRTGRLAYSCIFRSCSGVVRSNKCIKFTLRNPICLCSHRGNTVHRIVYSSLQSLFNRPGSTVVKKA
jgi:hypothetical protein